MFCGFQRVLCAGGCFFSGFTNSTKNAQRPHDELTLKGCTKEPSRASGLLLCQLVSCVAAAAQSTSILRRESDWCEETNVFDKLNDQSQTCLNFGLARKSPLKRNYTDQRIVYFIKYSLNKFLYFILYFKKK